MGYESFMASWKVEVPCLILLVVGFCADSPSFWRHLCAKTAATLKASPVDCLSVLRWSCHTLRPENLLRAGTYKAVRVFADA